MKEARAITPNDPKRQHLLDELIEKQNLDEMSLLDLMFIEDILNQERETNVL